MAGRSLGNAEGERAGGDFKEIMRSLYAGTRLEVDWDPITISGIQTGKGLRQGCVLSPILFALYLKRLGDALMESGQGVRAGAIHIPALFFADDVVLMAESRAALQVLMDRVGDFGKEWRLEVNKGKTKVMIFGRGRTKEWRWQIGEVIIEQTDEYKYLGVLVSGTGKWWSRWEKNFMATGRRLIGRLRYLAGQSCNRSWVARVLWENVAMSILGYGSEVIPMSKKVRTEWEFLQSEMARYILGASIRTRKEALRGDLGWWRVDEFAEFRKVKTACRYRTMPLTRWPRLVFDWLWTERIETPWWNEMVQADDEFGRVNGDWGSWNTVEEALSTAHETAEDWVLGHWKEVVDRSESMRYYGSKRRLEREWFVDHTGRDGVLLFKGRSRTLALNDRKADWGMRLTRGCDWCGQEESLEHVIFECREYADAREGILGSIGNKSVEDLLGFGVTDGRELGKFLVQVEVNRESRGLGKL